MGKRKSGKLKDGGTKRRKTSKGKTESHPDASVSNRSAGLSSQHSQHSPPRKKSKLAAKKPRKSHVAKRPVKQKTSAQRRREEGVVQSNRRSGSEKEVAEQTRSENNVKSSEKGKQITGKNRMPSENTGSCVAGPSERGPPKKHGKPKPLLTIGRAALSIPSILGTDHIKEQDWKIFLQQAVDIIKDAEELDAAAKKKAAKTVMSLETKEKATKAGWVALKNFEYFDEDRIRTVICVGFEDYIPGEWKCGWSSQRVKKIAFLLMLFTARTLKTDSRILKGFSIFMVAGVLNAIFTSENGGSVVAWGQDRFRSTIWNSVDVMLYTCYKEHERSNVDLSPIKDSIDLMALLCRKVAPLFENRGICDAKDVIREVRNTLGANHEVDVLWTRHEVEQVMNALPTVSIALYNELVPQIWDKNTNKKPQQFTITTLIFEALYLLRDIFYPIWIWHHKDWNQRFQDLMFELAREKDQGYYVLDFDKVFSVIHVLHGSGLKVENLDTDVLAEQLVGRINVKGEFTELRVREDIRSRYRRRLAVGRKPKNRSGPNKIGRFAAE